jgi:UDP-GlcNAc:undecaprenyl-phosphate GlcNAc-1-phosphate transferase
VPNAAWAPLIAFTVALILVWRLTRGRFAQIAVDRPNERSLHTTPILLAWPIVGAGVPTVIFLSLIALLAVSAVDDVRGLPVIARLTAHLLAGGAVSAVLLLPDFGPAAVIISTLGMVWMTNLYNFMDGSDGLAGGMTLLRRRRLFLG